MPKRVVQLHHSQPNITEGIMWLPVCGDPDCPNKSLVEELEQEVERLKRQLAAAREAQQKAEDDRGHASPRFKYPQ